MRSFIPTTNFLASLFLFNIWNLSTNVVTGQVLDIVKNVSDDTPYDGDIVLFTIEITNTKKNYDSTSIELVESLPYGKMTWVSAALPTGCYIDYGTNELVCNNLSLDLGPEEVYTITYEARVDGGAVAGEELVTTTTVIASLERTNSNSPNSAQYTDSVSTTLTVAAPADVQLTMDVEEADGVLSYSPGGRFKYTVHVENNGWDIASNVVFVDTLPAGLKLKHLIIDDQATGQSGSNDWLSCVIANEQDIICNIQNMPVGFAGEFQYKAKVRGWVTSGTTLTNAGSVTFHDGVNDGVVNVGSVDVLVT